MAIMIAVSPGELIDKLTILQIKRERISDPAKLANIGREHDAIDRTFRKHVRETPELADLIGELKIINLALWKVEDDIRLHERNGDFGEGFVHLARSVYRMNDRRAAIKRRINDLLDSDFVEEKSYFEY